MNNEIMKTISCEFQKWLDRLANDCANKTNWRDLLSKVPEREIFLKRVKKELLDIGFQSEEISEIKGQFEEQIKYKQENKMFVFTRETAFKILAFCLLGMSKGTDNFETISDIRNVMIDCGLNQSLFEDTDLKEVLIASEDLYNYRTNPHKTGN